MDDLVAAAAAAMEDDTEVVGEVNTRKRKSDGDHVVDGAASALVQADADVNADALSDATSWKSKSSSRSGLSAAKSRRLEQNRRAAIESRRRKKVMVRCTWSSFAVCLTLEGVSDCNTTIIL